jgi:hypothetical protein
MATKARTLLRWLILAQWAVTLAAFVNEFVQFCTACAEDRSFIISGAGTIFYGVLAFLIWRRPDHGWIRPLLLVGLGTHSMLAADLVRSGHVCWMCLTVAAGSVLMAATALAPRPRAAVGLLWFWPLGAAAAASALPFVSDPQPSQTYRAPPIHLSPDSGEIVVIFLYGCGACEGFLQEKAPLLLKAYVETGVARLRYVPSPVKAMSPVVQQAHAAAFAAEDQGKGNEVTARLLHAHKTWNASGDVMAPLRDLPGLDLERLRADMAKPEVLGKIDAVKRWREQIGLHQFPGVWVHARGAGPAGRLLSGLLPWKDLKRLIDLELQAGASAPPSQ